MRGGGQRKLRLARLASRLAALGGLTALVGGCLAPGALPLGPQNQSLSRLGSSRSPALGGGWLALISGTGGREQVQLIDLQRNLPVPLPGLNRPDAQPLSVAVDQRGERLALVRQLEGRTEVVLYRRSTAALQPLPLQPTGVAQRLQLRADGRQLAVEVNRNGLSQIDLIDWP